MNIPGYDIYDTLKKERRPIVIYGMGNGADKIINELQRHSIKISGVCASDDFVRGQTFRGFTVGRLSDAIQEDCVLLCAFGTQLPEVMSRIFDIADNHTLLAPDVSVYGTNIWSREFFDENRREIENAYSLLADDISRYTFEGALSFKLTGRLDFLRNIYSDKMDALTTILHPGENESYLDLGAYRGDTIDEFLSLTGGRYGHITALEPDRRTFAKLKAHVAGMKNVKLFRMGIWSEDMNLAFSSSLGRGSSVTENGEELAVTKIDTLYSVRHLSYCKMDVEGAERQALIGGINTLRRDKPKLNIAAYHRSEDIFSLPLLLHDIVPGYKIYMRQHPYIPAWDLNIYAV